MAWQGIEGHDPVVAKFRRALSRNRLASTFLFVGPAGIGKRAFAEKLGAGPALLRIARRPNGSLRNLHLVPASAGAHASRLDLDRKAGRQKHDSAGGVRRRRFAANARGIVPRHCAQTLHGRAEGGHHRRRRLSQRGGANCLLKTLEEPPPNSVLILIGTSADKQLPTIRSRAQTIRFQPLDRTVVAGLLESQGLVADRAQAVRLSEFAEGSLQRALDLADDDLWAFRRRLLEALGGAALDSVALAQDVVAFVEAAGKEASRRRGIATGDGVRRRFHRQLLRAVSGCGPRRRRAVGGRGSGRWAVRSTPGAAAAITRSLELGAHIDRNAHQTTLLECWLDDLSRIVETGHEVSSLPEFDGRNAAWTSPPVHGTFSESRLAR